MSALRRLVPGLVASVLIGGSALALQGRTFEMRPGHGVAQQNYQSIPLPTSRPVSDCQARCEADRRCDAYTWQMSVGNTTGLCYLYAGSVTPVAAPTVTLGLRSDWMTPAQREASRLRAQRSSEEVVDLYAPRIRPRTLSTEERGQVQALLNGALTDPYLTWDRIEPLMALAESGDKEAMHAVLRAFKGPERNTINRHVWFAPLESFDGLASSRLAARWAGEYWRRHGADPIAAAQLASCTGESVQRCGVFVRLRNARERTAFLDYGRNITRRAPRLDLVFEPAYPGVAGLRARFDELTARRRAAPNMQIGHGADGWMAAYAAVHPEVAATQQATLDTVAAEAERVRLTRLAWAADARARAERMWNDLWGRADLTSQQRSTLEVLAVQLGDDYVVRLAGVQPIYGGGAADILCRLDHPTCQSSRRNQAQQEAARQAEIRQTAADAAARQSAVAAAMGSGVGMVDVRRYDRAGNYVGTTTMTRSQAETIGARPQ
ncbi:MAG: PAN domain-containing protein [Brevundimonas sp.]|uniref:PAN domain-containing protein n=1 Tax=Brevundimonas sp. TaxID=1871086 RepID=UPI0040349D50